MSIGDTLDYFSEKEIKNIRKIVQKKDFTHEKITTILFQNLLCCRY